MPGTALVNGIARGPNEAITFQKGLQKFNWIVFFRAFSKKVLCKPGVNKLSCLKSRLNPVSSEKKTLRAANT